MLSNSPKVTQLVNSWFRIRIAASTQEARRLTRARSGPIPRSHGSQCSPPFWCLHSTLQGPALFSVIPDYIARSERQGLNALCSLLCPWWHSPRYITPYRHADLTNGNELMSWTYIDWTEKAEYEQALMGREVEGGVERDTLSPGYLVGVFCCR